MSGGYGSSGSSRGSTPIPRSSNGYLQPITIQPKEPKQTYSSRTQGGYLSSRPATTLITPRGSSSSSGSRSSSTRSPAYSGGGGRTSGLSVDYPDRRINDRVLDKAYDSRYHANSFLDGGVDGKKKKEGSRKEMDSRYWPDSSYYRN